MKKALICLFSATAIFFGAQAGIPKEEVYLHVNLHYFDVKGECKASYANFTGPGEGHDFILVNTKVTFKKWKRGVLIIPETGPEKIYFEYHEPRMGMSLEDYLNIVTGSSELSITNFTEVDQQGIREGKALIGMSKDAVEVALGYPAAHKTPSLDGNTWTFWINRFKSRQIVFDASGMVESITPDW